MRRTHCVSVRLNPAELALLDSQRGTLPRGAQMRRAWAGVRLPRPVPAINAEALAQLRGIATNLNQLARRTNAGDDLDFAMLSYLLSSARAVLAGIA